MLRGFWSGITGLKAQGNKMEVIGNNVANIDTAGYKKDRIAFQELFYHQIRQGSDGDGNNIKGTNPMDVGLGVTVASVDKIFNQGARKATGRAMDFMIEGNDFFVVQNGGDGTLMLTRNGAFQLDSNGYLVDSLGNKVQGFNVSPLTNSEDTTAQDIIINNDYIPPNATGNLSIEANIDSSIIESSADGTTNAWELFSGGENFGNMSAAITGQTGSRAIYGSGYYEDSVHYSDSNASINTALDTVTIAATVSNLIEGFSVGDTISIRQGTSQMQKTITAINAGARTITLNSAASGFSDSSTVEIINLTDGRATRGTSGSSSIHNDLLRSQVAMVNGNGELIASFHRTASDPKDYTRSEATVSGGGTLTIGTGEFSSMAELTELVERVLRDTQLTNYSASTDLDVSIDKYEKVAFSGTGLVSSFRLVFNADNTEMIDRFQTIAITDNAETAVTQARVDSSGNIIAAPSLASVTARTDDESKNWFSVSGIENYGYSATTPATSYGEYASMRLDGGANGSGTGILQMSLTNGLGNTVVTEFHCVSKNPDPGENQFTNMGELASLIQTTLRSASFSSLAQGGSLINDSTANATFANGRLSIETDYGTFKDLTLSPLQTTTSPTVLRSDYDNFASVLGQLSQGINGKKGVSNAFIAADVVSQTHVYDSLGNEHTSALYFVRDRSSGLSNIEWKYKTGINPNFNTFSNDDPDGTNIYRDTYNSSVDSSTSHGVVAFNASTGQIIENGTALADSRYSTTATLDFTPQSDFSSQQAAPSSITVDLTDITSYNGDSSVISINEDGWAMGSLLNIKSEDNTGQIYGAYSNGQVKLLAKVGLMSIANPEGLQKIGSSYFQQTQNSNPDGEIKELSNVYAVNAAATLSSDNITSRIHGNALESSNVDISEELTEMIITQRSYSAAGKIITTSDEMIQEALQLKR